MNIIPLFCDIDDFLMLFEQWMQTRALPPPAGEKKCKRKQRMHTSEVMTIRVNFHQSKYRTFKDYYLKEVSEHLQWAFPNLVIYGFRFLELMPETWLALWTYLRTRFRTQSPSACCQLFCKYRSCFDCLYVSREETCSKSARLSGNQRFTGTHFLFSISFSRTNT